MLISSGSATLGAALLSPASGFAAVSPRLPAFRRSSYTALTDLRFRVRPPQTLQWTELTLTEVGDLAPATKREKYRGAEAAFRLELVGPPGLVQDTYRVNNRITRPADMFVTPIERAGDFQRYEIVVDRLYAPTRRHPAPRPRRRPE